ncbi:SIMPL domain-containing protein [Brotaphodocola sp.]|uniref:SIMPL domain-containing protein n=1 Tax=Brotaphodocola sp. TaxID=3073577 RepID=UPI003D7CA5DC
MKRYLIAVATASTLILSGCSSTVQLPDTVKVENIASERNSISVSGQEEVKVTPDIAEIRYSVYTRAETPSECQQKNTTDVNSTLEVLKGLGINENSIQTSAYGLNPIRDWESSNGDIVGYEMTTTLTVSDIPIDQAGTIISQSVSAGINDIDSVSYSASNYDASYQEALKGAMANARAKADAIAEADDKSVVGIIHAEENGYNPSTRYSVYESAAAGSSMKSSASVEDLSVMPGQVSITAYVQVEYEVE